MTATRNTPAVTSYQNQADMTQPYKVRTGCGHIVIRRMRPATAGVPFTPETIIEAPNGRHCDECETACRLNSERVTELQSIPQGNTRVINGLAVTRWSNAAFEVSTWGKDAIGTQEAIDTIWGVSK